jgi:HK97 family phage portal protein
MSPAFRQGSFLDRLQRAIGSKSQQSIPAPGYGAYQGFLGFGNDFKPIESVEWYGDSPWLYAAVNAICQEVARIKLHLRRDKADGSFEKVLRHQALETLQHPQPTENGRSVLTNMQLKYLLAQHLMLNGEGFWVMTDRLNKNIGGAPTAIYPLLPGFVTERLDRDSRIESYFYVSSGRQIQLNPMDVIHFKLVDPANWYRGHSPLKSIRHAIEASKAADIFNTAMFRNGAFPGGFLNPKQKITPEDQKRIKDQFNQRYGGASAAGQTVVLPSEMEYQPAQNSNADMQYAELKQIFRDEILANMRVGMEMLGKTESQTRANAEASNYVFQRFTILPLVEFVIDVLNNDYLPSFPGTEGLYFAFDEFVPENIDTKRANVQTLSDIGALSPNEARETFGLEPRAEPEADALYITFNKTPIAGTATADPDIEADLEGDPVDEEDEDEQDRMKRDAQNLPPDTSSFFDKHKETIALATATLPFFMKGFQRGVSVANENGGTPIAVEDVFTSAVKEAIKRRNLYYAAQAVQTTEDDLREVLLQAKQDNVGLSELAGRINDLYGSSMGYRSKRIARTESTGAINDGTLQTLTAKGYETKTWSTIMDGHERDSHATANGQTVPIDQPFHLAGGTGMAPGDPSLPPSETVNCRCVVQGGGTSEDRQQAMNQMFLRLHAPLEQEFASAVKREFENQRARILSHFPTR